MSRDLQQRARFDFIRYAQCWEDPASNTAALRIGPGDNVLSVASGGDNSFALLLDDPARVVALDINPVQIYLCELKQLALRKLDHVELLSLLGVIDGLDRPHLYRRIRGELGPGARAYWDANLRLIEQGLIHAGKFERYLRLFRRVVLPLTQSRGTVDRMLGCASLQEQQAIYQRHWNNPRWRAVFKVFFGRFMLGRLGRDPEFFRYVQQVPVSERLFRRAEHAFTQLSIQDNFYWHYILKGRYLHLEHLPPYLLERNLELLKRRIERLSFRCQSFEDYLQQAPPRSIDRINFSDIFEYISVEQMAQIFDLLCNRGRPGMTIVYRNLFVPRSCPKRYHERFEADERLGQELQLRERAFFYNRLVIERLK